MWRYEAYDRIALTRKSSAAENGISIAAPLRSSKARPSDDEQNSGKQAEASNYKSTIARKAQKHLMARRGNRDDTCQAKSLNRN